VSLSSKLKSIVPGTIVTLYSEGEWSMHNLLAHLLFLTGPANVSIASFSISEEAVRTFNQCKENADIKKLLCLFDYTMRSHKIDLMLFLQSIADEIRTTHNHAKLLIIENDNWQIAVMSTANLNNNSRLELYSIFINTPEFNFFSDTFFEIWTKSIPYN
jgi:hypothetical protein